MTRARELRFAFVFDDHEAALHLFRDVLGLEMLEEFHNQGGRGVILRVPSATLEVFNPEYGQYVDEIEVGRPVDSLVRIAVNVDDLAEAGRAVGARGHSVGRSESTVQDQRRPPADSLSDIDGLRLVSGSFLLRPSGRRSIKKGTPGRLPLSLIVSGGGYG
jgi:catechol 2,3-dioxygenase-like lactoylglutathione lyase family enzyme